MLGHNTLLVQQGKEENVYRRSTLFTRSLITREKIEKKKKKWKKEEEKMNNNEAHLVTETDFWKNKINERTIIKYNNILPVAV